MSKSKREPKRDTLIAGTSQSGPQFITAQLPRYGLRRDPRPFQNKKVDHPRQ